MEQLLSTFTLSAQNLLFGISSASSNKFLDLKLKNRTINIHYFISQVLSTGLQENTSKWDSQPKGHTLQNRFQLFSITRMSFAFPAHCPKQWSQFLILRTQPDMWRKNMGRLFENRKHKQSNPVGFISSLMASWSSSYPTAQNTRFCLHWGRSLLESTAGFHTGFYQQS